jgi:uncharacterized protein YcaQ
VSAGSAAPLVSRRAAAALYLERQWLDRPRGRRLTARTLPDFVSQACGLQIDSVNVVDRAHHLTLWSRFGPYDRRRLERLTYRDRILFEDLTHVACFVATRDLPLHKAVMLDTPRRFDARHRGWRRRNTELLERVAQAVAERGPLGNADFERPKHMGKGGGWWSWKPATHALDYLWKAGLIGVHSREHFHKRYAGMSRVLPGFTRTPAMPLEQAARERLLRSLAAPEARELGRPCATDVAAVEGAGQRAPPRSWPRGSVRGAPGEPCTSRGCARRGPARAARAHRRRAASSGTTLLAVRLFLWHRERAPACGLLHRIEIYVPGHKRQHGYYSLPLLHDGQLLGRVDLKTHREEGVLEARHVHLEPWFAAGRTPPRVNLGDVDRDEALAGLSDALRSLARHLNGDVARPLRAKLRPALLLARTREPRK